MSDFTAPPTPECNGCDEYKRLSRRSFMAMSGATAAALTIPAWMPRVSFAADFSHRDVIVSIFLRGAADGLTLCVPYGDAGYYAARPHLGVLPPGSTNGCTDLNGFFGFPPAMSPLAAPYLAGHLAVVHATGSTDSSRSHFDAQKYMELGKPNDASIFTGWLGRHIATVNPAVAAATVRAIGIGYQLQLSYVRGKAFALTLGLTFKLVVGPALILLLFGVPLWSDWQVLSVTVFEAAMGPMIGASIVAMDHELDPPLVTLLVGVGIPVSFLTLPAWWYLLSLL